MKIVSWNCQGLSDSRMEELKVLIDDSQPDIVCLQETWFTTGKPTNFDIDKFFMLRSDRRNGKARGGTAILVKEGIVVDSLTSARSTLDNEFCTIRVKCSGGGTISITSAYIPPDVDFDGAVMAQLLNGKAIVMGDLNAHVDWCGSPDMNTAGDKLTALLHRTGTGVLNKGEPTHWSRAGLGRTLDFAIPSASLAHNCLSFEVLDCYGSDHAAISVNIAMAAATNPGDTAFPALRRDWSKADWDAVSQCLDKELSEIRVPSLMVATAADIDCYDDEILKALKKAIALVPRCPARELRSWKISKETKQAIRTRHRFQRLFQKTKLQFHKTLWNRASRMVRQLIAQDKGRVLKRRVKALERHRHVNITKFWAVVKQITSGAGCSNQRRMPPITSPTSGHLVCDDQLKAEVFASHLASTFEGDQRTPTDSRAAEQQQQVRRLMEKEELFPPLPAGDPRRASISVSRSEMKWATRRLRAKAPGVDEVPNQILKKGGTSLHKHLRQLFNLSMATGYLPTRWKLAVIVPLPRQGKDTSTVGGYRPVSLLPTVAKLLESIIARKVYGILEKAKALPDHQSGFRSHRSTEDQLFRLAETVGRAMRHKKVTVATFLDFQGAFNSVWHDGLRYKMWKSSLGNAPGLVRWLSNFLRDRQFCVRVGMAMSSSKTAKTGVPQGSCLSPILFILFTSDMFSTRNHDERPAVGSYADDVMIMASDKEPKVAARVVQLALRQAEWWSMTWKLPLQPTKCVTVAFSRKHTAPTVELYLDGSRLEMALETKYLGVIFDRKMNFRSHFREVVIKAEKRLNGLRRLCGRDLAVSREAAVQIYKSLTRSVIEYGAPAWVSRFKFKTDTKRFQTLQNRCLRAALRVPYRTKIAVIHAMAKIEPIHQRLVSRCRAFIIRAQRHVYGVRHLVKQQYLEPSAHPGPTAILMPTERKKKHITAQV